MKLKLIAAAVATLSATGAFAACTGANTTLVDTTNCTLKTANTTVYYVAGASAQAQAFNIVAPTLFDTAADVVKLTSTVTDAGDQNKHVAYFGLIGGAKTLVVYRNAGGSGAGVRQLQSLTTALYDALNGASGENNALTLGTTTPVTIDSNGKFVSTSSTSAKQVPVVALSDVGAIELASGVVKTAEAGKYLDVTTLNPQKTALQGFGVAVSNSLYNALVAQNAANGYPVDSTGQPTITKAAYAALVATETFAVKSAAAFLGNSDTTKLTVCRRADTSGTQAASNMFFLNNVSGTQGFFGALNPETAGKANTFTSGTAVYDAGVLDYNFGSSTGNVKTCLNGAGTNYAIGVMSLENIPGGSDTWKWVKIDNVSPDYTYDKGTSAIVKDPMQRQQFASGAYPFAYEMVVLNTPAGASLASALATKLSDSTVSDLPGIAYIEAAGSWNAYDSTLAAPANRESRVQRNGNNSAPLQLQQ